MLATVAVVIEFDGRLAELRPLIVVAEATTTMMETSARSPVPIRAIRVPTAPRVMSAGIIVITSGVTIIQGFHIAVASLKTDATAPTTRITKTARAAMARIVVGSRRGAHAVVMSMKPMPAAPSGRNTPHGVVCALLIPVAQPLPPTAANTIADTVARNSPTVELMMQTTRTVR